MSTDNNQLPPLPTPPHRFAVELTPTGKRLDYTADDMHAYARAALAQRQGEPVWSEYVAGMIVAYLGGGVDDPRIKPIAGIISRRLVHIAPATTEYLMSEVNRLHDELVAAQRQGEPVTAVTDEMVSRFLCWSLPKDFCPDGGVNFDGRGRYSTGYETSWPIGTNLFTARQAKELLEHVISRAPATAEQPAESQDLMAAYRRMRQQRGVDGVLVATAPAPVAEPTTGYVQRVPDHCDRITWRNRYYQLPLDGAAPAPVAPTMDDALAAGDGTLHGARGN